MQVHFIRYVSDELMMARDDLKGVPNKHDEVVFNDEVFFVLRVRWVFNKFNELIVKVYLHA